MAGRKLKLTHPGKILREEFMEPVGITAYALAKALHVPLPRVNDIVREKRAISPEMAKDRVAKLVARIQPHPRDSNGALQPI